jgi:L-threonylcarbamoyladenylate synthase
MREETTGAHRRSPGSVATSGSCAWRPASGYIRGVDPQLEARVEVAAAVLRRGGLVAYPTETFYGLGALARDGAAVARLARAKGRPDGKPLPLLGADRAQVDEVAVLSPLAARLADALWPGPLTLVLAARAGLAPEIVAGTGSVGVRIAGSELARALARAAGGAIVATSANLAGEAPPARPEALTPFLLARLDHVLDGGPTPGGLPSTVVQVEGEAVRLLREGATPFGAVLACLRRTAP